MIERLPKLITEMRKAIDADDRKKCLRLQGRIEEEWGAIKDALEKAAVKADLLESALLDLTRGEW